MGKYVLPTISQWTLWATAYLRDLLNVPYGLETKLNLTKGRHIAGLGGRSPKHLRLGRNTAERTAGKHDEDGEGVEVVGVGEVLAVDVDTGKWRVHFRAESEDIRCSRGSSKRRLNDGPSARVISQADQARQAELALGRSLPSLSPNSTY